jgi:O-antigen/teichoic acid export membrane protein
MIPFSPMGTGHVMIKYASRDREELGRYFGNALLVTCGSGLILVLFVLAIRPLVLPRSATFPLIMAVAIADMIFAQITFVCSQAFLALNRAKGAAYLLIVAACLRLGGVLIFIASGARTPMRWAHFYLAASVIAAIQAVISVSKSCMAPRFELKLLVPSLKEGFHFSTSLAAQTVYNDIDKTMLAKISTVQAAAIYAVAYRFIEASMLPIRSLQSVTYPEFFRQGAHGVTTAYKFAKRILRKSLLYGLGASLVLFFAAGFLPMIMGAAYAESAVALRWLCLLPMIKSFHSFLTDTLTGANFQWQRSTSQIAVAIFNVVINLWLIRVWSWRGAAWSSLATDGLLAVILFIVIQMHLRREKSERGTPANLARQPEEELA